MIVGVLTVDLAVYDAHSLKDKRRVVLSLKTRLRNRFNASVAEVEFADQHKQCRLAVAIVSQEARVVHSQLDKVVDFVRGAKGLSLVEYHRELF